MRRKTAQRLATAALVLGLGACATTNDPRQGGFFGGVGGLASGNYEKRLEGRQAALQQEQELSNQLRTSTENMRAENAQVQAQLKNAERDMAAMRAETDRLQASLQTEKQRQTVDEQTARRLQAEIDHVQQQIDLVRSSSTVSPQETEKTLVQLKSRLEALNQTFLKAMQRS